MRVLIIVMYLLLIESNFATIIEKDRHLEDSDISTESPQPSSSIATTVSDGGSVLPVSTTHVSPIPCPPEKSLLTREDIKRIINYRVVTLSIYTSINNSYNTQAVAMRDKHVKDFKKFLRWYQNRPEHLKHVLDDFTFLKGHIEPLVKRVAESLEQYPQLQEKHNERYHRTKALLRKLNKYQIICENNCETNHLFSISRRMGFHEYYCSSIEDLNKKIIMKLKEFVIKISSNMLDRITRDHDMYSKKIDVLKNKLKDIALKELGRTMYDVLTLKDEYHHYINDLTQIDSNSEVYKIKEMGVRIDGKLLELEQLIEKHGAYCRTCNKNSPQYISKKTKRNIKLQGIANEPKNFVDHLLYLKYREIQNNTNNDYSDIFEELNSLLNKTESNIITSTNFKPIQDEVVDILKVQRTGFNELKNIAAPTSVKKIIKLSSDSEHLLTKINYQIDYLSHIGQSNEAH